MITTKRLLSLEEYNYEHSLFEEFKHFIVVRVDRNFDVIISFWSGSNKSAWVSNYVYILDEVFLENSRPRSAGKLELVTSKMFYLTTFYNIKQNEDCLFSSYFCSNINSIKEIITSITKCFTDLYSFLGVVYGNEVFPTA